MTAMWPWPCNPEEVAPVADSITVAVTAALQEVVDPHQVTKNGSSPVMAPGIVDRAIKAQQLAYIHHGIVWIDVPEDEYHRRWLQHLDDGGDHHGLLVRVAWANELEILAAGR